MGDSSVEAFNNIWSVLQTAWNREHNWSINPTMEVSRQSDRASLDRMIKSTGGLSPELLRTITPGLKSYTTTSTIGNLVDSLVHNIAHDNSTIGNPLIHNGEELISGKRYADAQTPPGKSATIKFTIHDNFMRSSRDVFLEGVVGGLSLGIVDIGANIALMFSRFINPAAISGGLEIKSALEEGVSSLQELGGDQEQGRVTPSAARDGSWLADQASQSKDKLQTAKTKKARSTRVCISCVTHTPRPDEDPSVYDTGLYYTEDLDAYLLCLLLIYSATGKMPDNRSITTDHVALVKNIICGKQLTEQQVKASESLPGLTLKTSARQRWANVNAAMHLGLLRTGSEASGVDDDASTDDETAGAFEVPNDVITELEHCQILYRTAVGLDFGEEHPSLTRPARYDGTPAGLGHSSGLKPIPRGYSAEKVYAAAEEKEVFVSPTSSDQTTSPQIDLDDDGLITPVPSAYSPPSAQRSCSPEQLFGLFESPLRADRQSLKAIPRPASTPPRMQRRPATEALQPSLLADIAASIDSQDLSLPPPSRTR